MKLSSRRGAWLGPATIGCLIAGPGAVLPEAGYPLSIVSGLGGTGRLPGAVGP